MNLRDLKYITAVAETHHFGKAAERCFVSQPTLSGGPLRIGAIPTLSPYLMTLILMPLKKQHPQMKLVLSEEMTDTLLERLRNHEIDAALLATAVDEPDLDEIPLFDEPFWLAHPRDHPFYNKEEITRTDLDNTELLLLSEGHCLAKQAMDICHLKQRKEQGEMADLRAASLETLLQLVSAGFGSTLVPALAMGGTWASGSGIATRKLEFKDTFRRVTLVFRKSYPRRQALDAFAQVVLENLPNTVQPLIKSMRTQMQ